MDYGDVVGQLKPISKEGKCQIMLPFIGNAQYERFDMGEISIVL